MELMTLGEFRATVDAMRGQRFPLLTHGGITLIDAMGGDRAIVDAARTTSDISAGDNADDVRLIRYLMRHRHTTPIEFCEVRLLIECPMDLWRNGSGTARPR